MSRPARHAPAARGAQSIERALLLLRLAAAQPAAGVAPARLAQAAGLERTTAYRIASALVRSGLLLRDAESGAYRPGIEAMALGLASLQRAPLVESCLPAMKALARRSGEPVFLVARAADHSLCLHLEQGERPVPAFAETVGSLRLLGLGIPSFALLARLDDAAVAAHHARHAAEYAAHGMSLAKLLQRVQQTRALGYAQITAQGVSGVGMRFALGSCGDAALAIIAPASRIPKSRAAGLAGLLGEELARLRPGGAIHHRSE